MTTNMLFSSVGDNTNFDTLWINENMEYDIYIIYYGDNDDIFNKYKNKVKYAEKRKGSKFQNFKYFYNTYPDIINKYERFFILDDDIIITVDDINKMFNMSIKYNLKICSPSLNPKCKHSFKITCNVPDRILTYTNYVEVGYVLLTLDAIKKFIHLQDDSLIGWGIDVLYMWCNGLDDTKSYAIIHDVCCFNPYDGEKPGKIRELSLLDGWQYRAQLWKKYATKINCPPGYPLIEHSSIMKKLI